MVRPDYSAHLRWFEGWMRLKLERNRHKDGWLNDADLGWLLNKATEELQEARDAVDALAQQRNPEALRYVLCELADVANVMLIAAVTAAGGQMTDRESPCQSHESQTADSQVTEVRSAEASAETE